MGERAPHSSSTPVSVFSWSKQKLSSATISPLAYEVSSAAHLHHRRDCFFSRLPIVYNKTRQFVAHLHFFFVNHTRGSLCVTSIPSSEQSLSALRSTCPSAPTCRGWHVIRAEVVIELYHPNIQRIANIKNRCTLQYEFGQLVSWLCSVAV